MVSLEGRAQHVAHLGQQPGRRGEREAEHLRRHQHAQRLPVELGPGEVGDQRHVRHLADAASSANWTIGFTFLSRIQSGIAALIASQL